MESPGTPTGTQKNQTNINSSEITTPPSTSQRINTRHNLQPDTPTKATNSTLTPSSNAARNLDAEPAQSATTLATELNTEIDNRTKKWKASRELLENAQKKVNQTNSNDSLDIDQANLNIMTDLLQANTELPPNDNNQEQPSPLDVEMTTRATTSRPSTKPKV